MSGSSRVYDPSKLHLKRELTQIRKSARVLRDPGTTSIWKSPLSPSRYMAPSNFNSNNSLHYLYHNNHEHLTAKSDDNGAHLKQRVEDYNDNVGEKEKEKEKDKEKERRVFLYNWRNNRSCSEKSLGKFDLDVGGVNNSNNNVNDGSARRGSDSVGDTLSDARNGGGDSKSDTCIEDHRRGRSCRHHQRRYMDAADRNFWKNKVGFMDMEL